MIPQGSPPAGEASAAVRARIVAAALAEVGKPYAHAGDGPDAFDDYGLVRSVLQSAAGVSLMQAKRRPWVGVQEDGLLVGAFGDAWPRLDMPPLAEREPGDVLVFRIVRGGPARHCGVMVSDDRFVHAYAGRAVVQGWLSRWWTERLACVFRVKPQGATNVD